MRTLEDIEKNSVDLKASRLAATIERDKFERRLNLKHPSQHIVTRKQLVLDYREYMQHH